MRAKLRRATRGLWTPSGALLAAAALAGCWSVAGFAAARESGIGAIVVSAAVMLGKFGHQHAVGVRERARTDDQDRRMRELADRTDEVDDALANVSRGIGDLEARLGALDDMRARIDTVDRESVGRSIALDEQLRLRLRSQAELIRTGLGLVRQDLDDLETRLPPSTVRETIDADVDDPLVSIAIPSFNRPGKLQACLDSIVREIEATGTDRVEVWITDDDSFVDRTAAIAHEFSRRYPYIGFRANAENLGLERNLLESCRPCRGEYIWIMGNDDLVHPGGLRAVLDDVAAGDHDVYVYDKVRIDNRGVNELPRTPGCVPDDIMAGDRRSFTTLMEFVRGTGVLSGLGFISTLVIRRSRFMAASVNPYLGLTMYPQVGVLLETCGTAPLLLNHTPIVFHRTTTRVEKLAESIGRREESFMAGGAERDGRWFGDSLAALFQRVIDRSALDVGDFVSVPEPLFEQDSLIGYIERNRSLGRRDRLLLAADIVADSERFLAALGRHRDEADSQPSLS